MRILISKLRILSISKLILILIISSTLSNIMVILMSSIIIIGSGIVFPQKGFLFFLVFFESLVNFISDLYLSSDIFNRREVVNNINNRVKKQHINRQILQRFEILSKITSIFISIIQLRTLITRPSFLSSISQITLSLLIIRIRSQPSNTREQPYKVRNNTSINKFSQIVKSTLINQKANSIITHHNSTTHQHTAKSSPIPIMFISIFFPIKPFLSIR